MLPASGGGRQVGSGQCSRGPAARHSPAVGLRGMWAMVWAAGAMASVGEGRWEAAEAKERRWGGAGSLGGLEVRCRRVECLQLASGPTHESKRGGACLLWSLSTDPNAPRSGPVSRPTALRWQGGEVCKCKGLHSTLAAGMAGGRLGRGAGAVVPRRRRTPPPLQRPHAACPALRRTPSSDCAHPYETQERFT